MKITFLFYDGMTALDAIGPHEVLSRIPNVEINRVALKAGNIENYLGLKLIADYSIKDISSTDILLVPGAGTATTLEKFPEVLEWIRQIDKTTKYTTSVCTGSLILGAAGLLKNIKATSHWAVLDNLKKYGAIPTKQRIVEDGKIITAAGVSAGIDMGLSLTAKLAGEDTAKLIQLGIEYDPEPPFDTGSPEKNDPKVVKKLLDVLKKRFILN